MHTLISDGGSMTVGRRTANYTWGAFEVTLPEGVEQQEPVDDRFQDGYIYRPDDRGHGRAELTFVRADARIDMNAERSDLEQTLDGASERTKGDAYYTRQLSGVGLGKTTPGVDYRQGDMVRVKLWSKYLELPVTAIIPGKSADGSQPDVSVQVGGQMLRDAELLRKRNDDIDLQIAAEKRERLRQVGAVDSKATQAKDTADSALDAVNDADGLIQGSVRTAREYSEESHEHSEASQRHSADSKIYSDLSHVYSQQSQQLSAQSVAHSAVSIEYSEASHKHSQKSQEHSEASFAHSDAARAYSEESHEYSQKSQEYSEASFGHSDAARIYSDAANSASQQAQQYSQQVQELQPEIEQAASDAQTASEESSQHSAESKTASEQSSVHSQAATDAAELSQESLRQAELARDAAETSRRDAETKRDEAEQARRAGFAAMTAASAAMAQAEQERAAAEEARRLAENERAAAEDQRRQAETARSGAESARDTAEQKRAAAEGERKLAETARSDAESARDTAEQKRAAAETARSAAETARSGAESARDTAEQKRADAESERALAEAARDTAEQKRAAAETEREKAEQSRQAAMTAYEDMQTIIDDEQNELIAQLAQQQKDLAESNKGRVNQIQATKAGTTWPGIAIQDGRNPGTTWGFNLPDSRGALVHAEHFRRASGSSHGITKFKENLLTPVSSGWFIDCEEDEYVRVTWGGVEASQVSIDKSQSAITPDRSEWTQLPSLTQTANSKATNGYMSLRVTWSGANRGSTYVIRILADGQELARKRSTTLGPLTFMGVGVRSQTLTVSNVTLAAGKSVTVEAYCSAGSLNQRRIGSAALKGTWIETQ